MLAAQAMKVPYPEQVITTYMGAVIATREDPNLSFLKVIIYLYFYFFDVGFLRFVSYLFLLNLFNILFYPSILYVFYR